MYNEALDFTLECCCANLNEPVAVSLLQALTRHNALQVKKTEDNSEKRKEILGQISSTMRHRIHLDGSIEMIGALLFGPERGSSVFTAVREPGLPLVDDWKCLKSMVTLNLLLIILFPVFTWEPVKTSS